MIEWIEGIWSSPWELYFRGLILLPVIVRIILWSGPVATGIRIHGIHVRWIFERLGDFPRGYAIAASAIVGLLVPAIVGLSRFAIGSFGGSWESTNDEQIYAILAFIFIHTILDSRRVWNGRGLLVKMVKFDIEKYKPLIDRMVSMRNWLKPEHRDDGNQPWEEGTALFNVKKMFQETVGTIADMAIDKTADIADKIMEKPDVMLKRWVPRNIAVAVGFHLAPVVFVYFMLS